MKYYQGTYDFQCKDSDYEYTGKSNFTFLWDEEIDKVTKLEMMLEDVEAFDLMKEVEVQTIRKYMVEDIKRLISDSVREYAIEHDLC